MRRGLVLGCGGPVGFGWTAGALAVLEAALSWDARDSVIVQGTSAGAEMAALLGAGVGVAEIVDTIEAVADGRAPTTLSVRLGQDPRPLPSLPRPTFPAAGLALAAMRGRVDRMAGLVGLLPYGRGDASFLRSFGDALAGPNGWVGRDGVRLVAADASTGELVAFGSAGAPCATLSEALVASWAVPGWFPPAVIGGRRYLDGGAVSPTSAHLLAELDLDEVVIVAPMSTAGGVQGRGVARAERALRRPMTRRVDREVDVLHANGIRVLRVEPGVDELAAMGVNFLDTRRRAAALHAARDYLPATIHRLLETPS